MSCPVLSVWTRGLSATKSKVNVIDWSAVETLLETTSVQSIPVFTTTRHDAVKSVVTGNILATLVLICLNVHRGKLKTTYSNMYENVKQFKIVSMLTGQDLYRV